MPRTTIRSRRATAGSARQNARSRARVRSGDPNPATIAGRPLTANWITALQRQAGNAAAAAHVRQHAATDDRSTVSRDADKQPPSVTGYLGLNPTAKAKEAAPLRKLLGRNLVTGVNDKSLQDQLSTTLGVLDWLNANLPRADRSVERAVGLIILLKSFPVEVRDALAPLIVLFERAELGRVTLERLVLSGHSDGISLWGDRVPGEANSPAIDLAGDLKRLARGFPHAAGQVEDVMFSACFSAQAADHVRAAFPNVRTVWAYNAFSPKAGYGSMGHIRKWEGATRGPGKSFVSKQGRGSAALANISDAKAAPAYAYGDPAKVRISTLKKLVDQNLFWVDRVRTGNAPPRSEQLRRVYVQLNQIIGHPNVSGSDKKKYETSKDLVLRLRFWPQVSTAFYAKHKAVIDSGAKAAGLPVPDFSTWSRRDLGKWALKMQDKRGDPAVDACWSVLRGLWHLDSKSIPSSWVSH